MPKQFTKEQMEAIKWLKINFFIPELITMKDNGKFNHEKTECLNRLSLDEFIRLLYKHEIE